MADTYNDSGIQALQGLVQSVMPQSLYEQHSPQDLYIANSLAGATKNNAGVSSLIQNAQKGLSVDDQDNQAKTQTAQMIASHIVSILPQLQQQFGGAMAGGSQNGTFGGASGGAEGSVEPTPTQNAQQPTQNGAPVHSGDAAQNYGDQVGPNGQYTNNPIQPEVTPYGTPGPTSDIMGSLGPTTVDQSQTTLQGPGPWAPPGQADEDAFNKRSDDLMNRMDTSMADITSRLGNQPQIPTLPALQPPNMWQSALGAAGALMFPQFSMDAAAAPFQSQVAWRDKVWNYALQNYSMQNQAWQEDIQHRQGLIGILAQEQNHLATMQYHIEQMAQRKDYQSNQIFQKSSQAYSNATVGLPNKMRTPEEVQTAANAYNQSLPKGMEWAKKGPDEVRAALTAANGPYVQAQLNKEIALRTASTPWTDKSIQDFKNSAIQIGIRAGVIDPKETREQQEKDLTSFAMMPTTDATYKQEAVDRGRLALQQQAAQFGIKIDWDKDKQAQDIAVKLGALENAKRNTAIHQQAVNNQFLTAEERIQLEASGQKIQMAEFNAKADLVRTLPKLQAQYQGAVDALNAIKTNPNDPTIAVNKGDQAKLTASREKLGSLAGQIQTIKSSTSPTIEGQTGFGAFLNGQPNPNYNPNAGTQVNEPVPNVGNNAPNGPARLSKEGSIALTKLYGGMPTITVSQDVAQAAFTKAQQFLKSHPDRKKDILTALAKDLNPGK